MKAIGRAANARLVRRLDRVGREEKRDLTSREASKIKFRWDAPILFDVGDAVESQIGVSRDGKQG